MLYGPLLVLLLHPSIVIFGPLGAGSALGVFCAFGGLLGVLRPLFAHRASVSVRPFIFSASLVLVVSVTRRCHARDEAGARGGHEEERDHAHGDGDRPKAPQPKEVAHQAEYYPHGPGRERFTLALRTEKAMPPAPKSSPARQQILPTSNLSASSRFLPWAVPSVNSSRLSRSVVRPQTLMPFSWRVSSSVLSQLWSMRLAISSSSALFRRAASAVSWSPAFSARRSRSW